MIPAWSGIVIFDGKCGVCNAIRERVEAHDQAGRLCFVAYQLTDLKRLSPGLTLERASHSTYFIHPDGRRVVGRGRYSKHCGRYLGRGGSSDWLLCKHLSGGSQ